MDLSGLRIGYVPYSESLDQPGDKRRFCYYAKRRNIGFEIAKPSESYDLVIVSELGDLSVWSEYDKGNAKVVYDLIDSYLAIPRWDPKGIFRGLAKYVAGQSRYLRLNHWKAIESMCRRADAVVCTTVEQKRDISKFCENIHMILDVHPMYNKIKTDYSACEVFNFVWEGLPQNIQSFYAIRDVLESLKTKHKFALHLVTALRYGQYMGKYWKRHTIDIARKLFDDVYLYDWNEQLCPSIICQCDMALIPLFLDDPFALGKPEDKLLLFWRMGMPTVVSATPSHERSMKSVGLSMACSTEEEWEKTLEKYMGDEGARREAGNRGKSFVEKNYNEEIKLSQWDNLVESVLS